MSFISVVAKKPPNPISIIHVFGESRGVGKDIARMLWLDYLQIFQAEMRSAVIEPCEDLIELLLVGSVLYCQQIKIVKQGRMVAHVDHRAQLVF